MLYHVMFFSQSKQKGLPERSILAGCQIKLHLAMLQVIARGSRPRAIKPFFI